MVRYAARAVSLALPKATPSSDMTMTGGRTPASMETIIRAGPYPIVTSGRGADMRDRP